METVIGLVAVFFVTGMIFWMRTHARFMKRDLEQHASEALSNGTTSALVVMAFLAVLREGFETSVFLLATFQSGQQRTLPRSSARCSASPSSVALGYGIYRGGVRLNLQRFFSITGLFLVLVAAGLVLSAFRTAHEAAWVTIGQATTVDLSWLAPAGSVQSALISGVLGIPRDPRVVEVLAWAVYLVPMLALAFWPARLRPEPALSRRLLLGGAAAAVVAAVAARRARAGAERPRRAHRPRRGWRHGPADLGRRTPRRWPGRAVPTPTSVRPGAGHWSQQHVAGDLPATLDVTTLMTYTGGRPPVGLDVRAAPGPYRASWTDGSSLRVTTHGHGLAAAAVTGTVLLRLSGGGLTSTRVVSCRHRAVEPRPVLRRPDGGHDRPRRGRPQRTGPLEVLVPGLPPAAWPSRCSGASGSCEPDLPPRPAVPAEPVPASRHPLEGTAHHARSSA